MQLLSDEHEIQLNEMEIKQSYDESKIIFLETIIVLSYDEHETELNEMESSYDELEIQSPKQPKTPADNTVNNSFIFSNRSDFSGNNSNTFYIDAR